MPSDWSRSWEVDRLVAGRLSFEGELPLGQLPRLQDRLMPGAAAGRAARASVRFARELDADVAHVRVAAKVPLRCERCMGQLDWPVDESATLALVANLADADRVPAGFEPVLAEAGRVQPLDLVEEELLLALPLIARHADATGCGAETHEDDVRQKPFAGLGELLKRP